MSQGDKDGSIYVLFYQFFSNESYFTGIYDMNTSSYTYTHWGIYDLDNETISFYATSGTDVTSRLDYSFSTDFEKMVLYFDDEQYLIFTKAETEWD